MRAHKGAAALGTVAASSSKVMGLGVTHSGSSHRPGAVGTMLGRSGKPKLHRFPGRSDRYTDVCPTTVPTECCPLMFVT